MKILIGTKCRWETTVKGVTPPPPAPKLAGRKSVKCENELKIEVVMLQ
jgi:hypothetical protein